MRTFYWLLAVALGSFAIFGATLGLSLLYLHLEKSEKTTTARTRTSIEIEEPVVYQGEYETGYEQADAKYKDKLVRFPNMRVDVLDLGGRPFFANRLLWESHALPGGSSARLAQKALAGGGGLSQPEPSYFFFLVPNHRLTSDDWGRSYEVTGRCLGLRRDGIDRSKGRAFNWDWRVEVADCTIR